MPSMFKNSKNIHITSSSISITKSYDTIITSSGKSLDVLHRRVAPNAILNAGGRGDEVRCHPGTRKEVIGRIEKWGKRRNGSTAPMFWLSGPAGAGKSAIMQTIAERYDQRGVPHANFFFFRQDSSRSHASPLVATLLHQIILLYPSLRDRVATLLSTNPLIFDSILEIQLAQLIVAPLRIIQQSSSDYHPLVLLIDGLDECDSECKRSQQQILHAFDQVLAEQPCPLRLLVASRDESHIQAAFNRISSAFLPLYLDDQYSPKTDIRLFVNAQFEQVRQTHPLANMRDATWPSVEDVDYIVEKSSGQFIYAATVMRFISNSSASPMVSLERVHSAARLATKSPFSHLDAIYTYILSQAYDQNALKDILHAHLLIAEFAKLSGKPGMPWSGPRPKMVLKDLLRRYNKTYTQEMMLSCLADLTSIAYYSSSDHRLLFHHASFPDYLLDQSRSGDYFVDTAIFNYKIMPVVWTHILNHSHDDDWLRFGLGGLVQLQKFPPGLLDMLAASRRVWPLVRPGDGFIFQSIYSLCVPGKDTINFRCILRQWLTANRRDFVDFYILIDDIKRIPFGWRYFHMAQGDSLQLLPDGENAAALCPETDFDRQESASWLESLLHRVHNYIYPRDTEHYKQLLKAWIFWAVLNNIDCEGLDNLPLAQRYIWKARAKKWFKIGSKGK
ncbi:hypothetical protein D9619_011137 [Psilocybe cf. subviscida]|uniref:NACHT domain-containing protein n=1 Tax=Psilocybe cf. subviscida TaxID=2480587 RepID=A0A8H5BL52_9AGAR|nr:hypothetical protein D9619_011137 [Psilocybe cf. subviscida]